ncbi:4-(cytidine 5'-diphospho)-2-C-methyl-D-erythritol kinase [Arthrobacter sp. Helios]|uniref:4-(cytidine 5'-diphospho)-2-C-methyl-D-erythritol kinase n=1 Tax=Arthrobacter sp. Helios TaxID=2828862 RepID=UPI002047DD42|nr:4-(cytidine 5'-diphospho)-2-C-methyl-D-erythritol kinase [Arthrobacter sp. Helios]UPO77606.1 4-(cytidine 5'-diphospho)-2-C-methyl-D-erythritol kinase [Arthrobacter sp. Helios]
MSLSAPRAVRVRAPGKINVSLRVGPLRPDGYHAVASVYLAVSLFEEVTATAAAEPGITVRVDAGGPLSIPASGIPLGPENLVARAAAALAGHAGVQDPAVDLVITKHVPVAGGMGGGSADAAAALLACNELWGTGLSAAELASLGSQLGADVPFALTGGAAVGLGTGDQLTPVAAEAPLHWVLVAADTGLSTPAVYGRLDALRSEAGAVAEEPQSADPAVLAALAPGNAAALASVIHNDLQPAALSLAPALDEVLQRGRDLGALAGIVSGSGPTLAFLAADGAAAARLETALRAEGHNALAVNGPAPGAEPAVPADNS